MLVARRTFLEESVYDSILESILSGALASGTEVSEPTLAKELGVSRTPVHRALSRLAKEGLIDRDTGRKHHVAQFRREDVVEIYEMRLLLETAAARRAAERIDPRILAELVRTAETLAGAKEDDAWREQALEFDVRFHDALARASGNTRLEKEISKYRLLVRAFCRRTGSHDNLRDALREHRAILSALEKKDGILAAQAMAAHIQARLAVVVKVAS